MRVALAGIMTATVITSSVPVNAVEPVAAKQEETAKEEIVKKVTINFYNEEDEKQVDEVVVETTQDELDTGLYLSKVKYALPKGYSLKETKETYNITKDGWVYVAVTENVVDKTKTVGLNYYDEDNKKQAKEVTIKVSENLTYLDADIIRRNMPEGYSVSKGVDFEIVDGWVYIPVVQDVKEETQTVKLNYYDEAAKKQVAEVSLKMSISDSAVDMATITRYLPEGYVLSGTNGSDCAIRDGYVYVSVSPIEETQTVKINYYDETEEKQVAEVPVQISSDRSELEKATVVRFLPAGYVLKNTDLKIRDGYVYVAVEKETEAPVDPENPEIPLTPLEPSTPVEKPEKPETPNKDDNQKEESNKKEESKKDDKKKAPKISDEANPMAAALPAGVSLAAILALLVKKFK